jgi:hypothetical protein
VLYTAGFTLPGSPHAAPVSGDYESWGVAGPGKEMTIWTSAGHIFLELRVSGQPHVQGNTVNPTNGGGFRVVPWSYSNQDAGAGAAAAGFVARHWPGT